jgi:hypothetical protein
MENNIVLERFRQGLCPVCLKNLEEVKKTETTLHMNYTDSSTDKTFEIEMCMKHDHTEG